MNSRREGPFWKEAVHILIHTHTHTQNMPLFVLGVNDRLSWLHGQELHHTDLCVSVALHSGP